MRNEVGYVSRCENKLYLKGNVESPLY